MATHKHKMSFGVVSVKSSQYLNVCLLNLFFFCCVRRVWSTLIYTCRKYSCVLNLSQDRLKFSCYLFHFSLFFCFFRKKQNVKIGGKSMRSLSEHFRKRTVVWRQNRLQHIMFFTGHIFFHMMGIYIFPYRDKYRYFMYIYVNIM